MTDNANIQLFAVKGQYAVLEKTCDEQSDAIGRLRESLYEIIKLAEDGPSTYENRKAIWKIAREALND